MSQTRKSYSVANYAEDDVPVPFDIDGVEFKAHPSRLPASVILDFNTVEIKEGSNATRDFFEAVLADDWPRFDEYLRTHDVPATMLRDIARDLVEDSTGRPTRPSQP